jgi:hypothetical protein
MKLDFITVVYDQEVHLLEWQAKSILKHVNKSEINKITVVDNGSQNCVIDLSWYGNLQNKVEVITHRDLNLYVQQHLDGWRTQQLCKILASARSQEEWSVVLDAKTFFSKQFNLVELFDNKRPCVGTTVVSQHWKDAKTHMEELLGVEMQEMIGPSGVPFFFHSQTVRKMISSIDMFNEWFQSKLYEQIPPHRTLVTEFVLYSSFVLKEHGKFSKLYGEQSKLSTFNVADWESDKFDKIFNTDAHTISVAEKTKKFLSKEQLERWEAFLHDKYC